MRIELGAIFRVLSDPNTSKADSHFQPAETSNSRVVTVYEPQKTTVYRQKYRRQIMAVASSGETTIDGQIAKNQIISTIYSHPETH